MENAGGKKHEKRLQKINYPKTGCLSLGVSNDNEAYINEALHWNLCGNNLKQIELITLAMT